MNYLRNTCVLILFCSGLAAQPPERAARVYFGPGTAPHKAIVSTLAAATKTIHVQAINLTDPKTVTTLIDARQRGVEVELCLARKAIGSKSQGADIYRAAGITVLVDDSHPVARGTVIVVDRIVVVTGSYHLTKHAQKAAENCVVIHDPALAEEYDNNWEARKLHCTPYK